jgi:hypothetical protein
MNKTRSHLHIFLKKIKSTLFVLYLNMFIFTINQDL